MINLAGSKDSDKVISDELKIARIPGFTGIVESYGEVNSTTVGLLGFSTKKGNLDQETIEILKRMKTRLEFLEKCASFIFTRSWYYYSVRGFVPEDVAWKIYNHPDNRDQYDSQGGVIRVAGHCGNVTPETPWLSSYKVAGQYCVDLYHIDTQLGLNTFVDIVTESGLV